MSIFRHRVEANALHGVFVFHYYIKEETRMENKRFLNVNDVAEFMGVSIPMAYKIIRRLNDELSAKGYITVSGRISTSYFNQKVYGGMSA